MAGRLSREIVAPLTCPPPLRLRLFAAQGLASYHLHPGLYEAVRT
jgi:hypothetical protein